MKAEEKMEIARIVERVIEADHARQEAAAQASRKVRHIRRRVLIVTTVAATVVATHHYTHIEPIGRIGEMTVGALFSWFFERAAKAGE